MAGQTTNSLEQICDTESRRDFWNSRIRKNLLSTKLLLDLLLALTTAAAIFVNQPIDEKIRAAYLIDNFYEKETERYSVIGVEGFAPKNEIEYIAALRSWESSAKLLLDNKGKYADLFYKGMLDSLIEQGTMILEEGVKKDYKNSIYSDFHLSIAYFENLFKARAEIRKDDDKFKHIVDRFIAAGYGAVNVFVGYANELAGNSR